MATRGQICVFWVHAWKLKVTDGWVIGGSRDVLPFSEQHSPKVQSLQLEELLPPLPFVPFLIFYITYLKKELLNYEIIPWQAVNRQRSSGDCDKDMSSTASLHTTCQNRKSRHPVSLVARPLPLPAAALVLSQRISRRFSDKTRNLNKSDWAIISYSPKKNPACINS